MPDTADDLCSRFLLAFNVIDEHLRQETRLQERDVSFKRVLDEYATKHRGWSFERDLRRCVGLRNVLVHDQFRPGQPPAIPTAKSLELIERIRDALLKPRKVLPDFQRPVVTAAPLEKIDKLLGRIRDADYSQFPVVAGTEFLGLVTENGITRWLAQRMTKDSMLELADHAVCEVLECEEARDNFVFVQRSTLIEDLIEAFRDQPGLEAALITERGDRTTSFLGIATRWDIVHMHTLRV